MAMRATRKPTSKLVGFKAEFGLARALEELATTTPGRNVSALMRSLARDYVEANLASLKPETRAAVDRTNRIKARHFYRPSLGE